MLRDWLAWVLVALVAGPARTAVAQCPWGRDPALAELRSACLCALNLSQQLSVQVILLFLSNRKI